MTERIHDADYKVIGKSEVSEKERKLFDPTKNKQKNKEE